MTMFEVRVPLRTYLGTHTSSNATDSTKAFGNSKDNKKICEAPSLQFSIASKKTKEIKSVIVS